MFPKNKKLAQILCPIEYYSSKNQIRKAKIEIGEIVGLLRVRLIGLMRFWNLDMDCSFEMLNSIVKYLLENHPKIKHKTLKQNTNSFQKDIFLSQIYYCGIISQERIKAQKIYENCCFHENEDYLYIVRCLIKLWHELLAPNLETSFEDFPEHLLATYNILCYYYLKSKNEYNIKEICMVLYVITERFLEVNINVEQKE